MNDGQSFKIENVRDVAVDSTTAYVVYRDDNDRYQAHWLSLVAMTRIERIAIVV